MRVLLTGAAGFIGSHLALELIQNGHEVHGVDNFTNSISCDDGRGASSLKQVEKIVHQPIPFTALDCCDRQQLDDIFNNVEFDAVIHLAALKNVPESVGQPLKYYANNLVSSTVLIQLCKKYNVKKFIFSGSCTVYGEPMKLPIIESDPVGERLTNPYAQTKFIAEKMLIDLAAAEKDWRIISLRYFNAAGAHPSGLIGEDPIKYPMSLMPSIGQVAAGKSPYLKVFGDDFDTPDGTAIRDYIHVVDLVRGHVLALNRLQNARSSSFEVFNLGTGNGNSIYEMVRAFEKASNRKIKTKVCGRRAGESACVYCDPSLANQELGFKCEYGLDDMCEHFWNWQCKNPNGYSPLFN